LENALATCRACAAVGLSLVGAHGLARKRHCVPHGRKCLKSYTNAQGLPDVTEITAEVCIPGRIVTPGSAPAQGSHALREN